MSVREAAQALLHQIDIGDFVDSHGHEAKMLRAVHALRAAIAADEDASTVRVPREPTETMLDAGYRTEADDGTPRDIWVAMIAAMKEPRNGS